MKETKTSNAPQPPTKNQQILQAGKNDPQNGIPAHKAAEADMLQDPDLNNTTGPDDGLDEGELARLEGED